MYSISIFSAIGSRASKLRRGSSRSPIASSFRTWASRTKHHPRCGRRRSPTFPTKRCCSCSRAAIAIAISSPISPGRSSESCPAPCVCTRSAISFTRKSGSVMPMRAQLVAPGTPCTKRRRLPRLRPSRHRALPLHEHPCRDRTSYLGDIGVPVDVNPMDFSAGVEVFVAGRWYTKDARHNHPRIGRIVMGRGRDAATSPCRPLSASPTSYALWW